MKQENQLNLFCDAEISEFSESLRQFRSRIARLYDQLLQKHRELSEKAYESLLKERKGQRRISARGNPAIQLTLFKMLFHPTYSEVRECQPVWFFRSEREELWA